MALWKSIFMNGILCLNKDNWLDVKETRRFDTNSSEENGQKFRSLQVKFAVEQEWVNIILRSLSQVRATIYNWKE